MHLRGAVSGRCATIPENRRAPYREVVRGSRCRLAEVDASMGQRLLDLLGSLQTLATVASLWIEIVALQPRLSWRPTQRRDLVRLRRLIARCLRHDLHLALPRRAELLLSDGPFNKAEGEKKTQDEERAFGLGHHRPCADVVPEGGAAVALKVDCARVLVAQGLQHLGQR